MIVRLIDGVVTQIALKQVKKEYPDTSFPVDLVVGRDYHTEYDFYVVDVKDKPEKGEGQRIVPLEIVMVDGVYTQSYEVVDVIVSTDPADYDLTPRQFHIFAAMWDYDDAIDAVLAGIKTMSIAQYASIKGDMLGAKVFRFNIVMGLIGNKDLEPFIPDGTDVTLATMSDRWLLAKAY